MGTITKSESFWEDPPPSSSHSHLSHSVVVSLGNMSQSLNTSHTNSQHHQYERNLNFSTVTVEDSEYGFQKKKSARDPLSHRIIEKRRRDRMNNCLADLARLLPQSSLRKGRGRIEKTEIVELAIKHLKHLQSHPCPHGDNCEFSPLAIRQQGLGEGCNSTHQSSRASSPAPSSVLGDAEGQLESSSSSKSLDRLEQFRLGYQECLKETMHFLVERKGAVTGDNFYVQLVDYLNSHAELFIPLQINEKQIRGCYRQNPITTARHAQEVLSDAESEAYLSNPRRNNEGSENDEPTNCNAGRRPSGGQDLLRVNPEANCAFDYEGDNNSCSSTPLSLDISDAISYDGRSKNTICIKPPIPSIIGSHSSSGSSAVLSSSNGRSSDEGSASASIPRYKFKSNIKQRFTADLETTPEVRSLGDWTASKNHHRHYSRPPQKSTKSRKQADTNGSSNLSSEGDEGDQDRNRTDFTEISEERIHEKLDLTSLGQNGVGNKIGSTPGKPQPLLEAEEKRNSLPAELSFGRLSMTGDQAGLPTITVTSTKQQLMVENMSRCEKLGLGHKRVPTDLPKEGVPAFALHETGLFYVPLTLDRDFVTPFCIPVDSTNSNPPLHPITISVCFLFGSKDAAGIRQAPLDIKFSDLNAQNGAPGALNLSKLNPSPSSLPYIPGSLYNSHGNPPPFMNHFHQPSSRSHYHPYGRDLEHSEFSKFSNSSPNGKYPQFPQLNQNIDSEDPNSKIGSSPPFELQHRLLIPYNQHHKTDSPGDPGRYSRKRHLAISSQSSASSSLSIGYHSWGENNQSGPTIVESIKDETNNRSYESWEGDSDVSSSKERKSPRTKAHDITTEVKSQRNGTDAVPKRLRKGNGSKKKT